MILSHHVAMEGFPPGNSPLLGAKGALGRHLGLVGHGWLPAHPGPVFFPAFMMWLKMSCRQIL